jgi:hypothetical protein
MVDGNLDAEFVGQSLKLTLPQPLARAVDAGDSAGFGYTNVIACIMFEA